MKLTDRTNALHLLEDVRQPVFSTVNATVSLAPAVKLIHYDFTAMRTLFRQKIQYIIHPFLRAYQKGRKRLDQVLFKEPIRYFPFEKASYTRVAKMLNTK